MQYMGDSISRKDHLLEKPCHHSIIIGGASKRLHPLGNILNGGKGAFVTTIKGERPHEVNIPNIKSLHFKNLIEGHFILS